LRLPRPSPAVYYKLYYVVQPDDGPSRIETIDANGGGQGVIWDPQGAQMSDSIAFDGQFLYVVYGANEIRRLTPAIPTVESTLYTWPGAGNITCLGIGHEGPDNTGKSILYFATAAGADQLVNGTNTTVPSSRPALWRIPLDQASPTAVMVAEWTSGNCQYVIQQQQLVLWTATDGNMWSFDTDTAVGASLNATLVASAAPGNLTGGITTASASNLLLYGSGERQIRSNQLDQLVGTQPGPPVDQLWTTLTGNNTYCLISLNGAVVASTDQGIYFWFGPFSAESTSQTVSRIILSTSSNIRGMATDTAAALAATSALFLSAFLMATVALL